MQTRADQKPNAQLSALAWEILKYLERHPHACDTLVGVGRWWLLKQRIETMTLRVKKALDELVHSGLVRRTKRSHGQPLYALNDQKLNELRSLLANSNEQSTP